MSRIILFMKFSWYLWIIMKHKILLKYLKNSYKEKDDIWDFELIEQQINEFFWVDIVNWKRKIIQDKYMKDKNREIMVKTKMFWWHSKHLNKNYLNQFLKNL